MKAPNPNNKCSDCGALHGQHSPRCELVDLETAKQQRRQYYEAWLKLELANRPKDQSTNKALIHARTQATLWHGKYVIVKHENNQLRSSLAKLKAELEILRGNEP